MAKATYCELYAKALWRKEFNLNTEDTELTTCYLLSPSKKTGENQ